MDVATIAEAASKTLVPFLPFLVSAGKAAGKKLEEVVTDQAAEALWERAKQIWERLTARFGDDAEVTSATTMVAAAPSNPLREQLLTEVLSQRLQADPQLAAELQSLLGGPDRVQRVAGGHDARLARIHQEMSGDGMQEVVGGDRAQISDVEQVMK
jgi:hypothetical protein